MPRALLRAALPAALLLGLASTVPASLTAPPREAAADADRATPSVRRCFDQGLCLP